jgi:signal-transduction protein with cAMP-binding, CBS, and nucleotidyltransferase domain
MKTGYTVGDVMTLSPVLLAKDEDLVNCAQEMAGKHVGAILVGQDNELHGILTEQDIVRKVIGMRKNPLELSIGDVMEKNVATIGPKKDLFEALLTMRDLNIRHLPVVEKGKLVGLLTLKDILKIQPQLFELLVEKFELREDERKPIPEAKEGICNTCGNYAEDVVSVGGVVVCDVCRTLE